MRSIAASKSAPPQITASVPGQTLLTAAVLSDGNGGFRIVPGRPVQEIPSREAAKILSICRGSLSLTINTTLGQKHLRWRWLTQRKGKRVFDLASVVAYREALKELE